MPVSDALQLLGGENFAAADPPYFYESATGVLLTVSEGMVSQVTIQANIEE